MTLSSDNENRTRSDRPVRALTPGRVVALALVALAAAGLAYLRFAPDAGRVSVPREVHAGDLVLKSCTYATEKGSYDADCGTLVVPENRHDPRSRLIALPVTRIHARSAQPAEPVFRLEGGPGISNMHFAKASRLAGSRDVVLVGYRGVDSSVRLDCPEVASALKRSTDLLGRKSFAAYTKAFRACATRLQADGVDLAGYSIPEQVDDLEAARKALGYGKIDLISESAGTRTAMIYAWRYPKNVFRSVMIGVNPPGHFLWDPKTTDAQIQRYSRLCGQDASCGARTDDLAASIRKTAQHMPNRFWGLPFDENAARIASFYGLMESTSDAAPLSGPMIIDSWLSAAKGDASGLWFTSVMARMAFPESFVWGELAAMGRSDNLAAKRYFASGPDRSDSILGNPGTEFLYAGGGLVHAWPATPDENEYTRVRDSDVETLLIGGTLDVATPAVGATRDLLPHLPNGHQVVLSELGHTTSFWNYEPKASTRLLNAFLDSGSVDRSLYTPARVDFTPEVTQTALGKGFAAGMIGLALLTVVSLLAMWRRVHTRGRIGRTSGALLRSLYPLLLGFGGWFLGLIIVMIAFPTVPLDDELLATLSVGLPIGLGIDLAWVHRDWSARTKAIGFAATIGGALVGAWLGYNAAEGLLALVTTIVGAAAASNLAAVGLDIAWSRSTVQRTDPARAVSTSSSMAG